MHEPTSVQIWGFNITFIQENFTYVVVKVTSKQARISRWTWDVCILSNGHSYNNVNLRNGSETNSHFVHLSKAKSESLLDGMKTLAWWKKKKKLRAALTSNLEPANFCVGSSWFLVQIHLHLTQSEGGLSFLRVSLRWSFCDCYYWGSFRHVSGTHFEYGTWIRFEEGKEALCEHIWVGLCILSGSNGIDQSEDLDEEEKQEKVSGFLFHSLIAPWHKITEKFLVPKECASFVQGLVARNSNS